MSISFLAQVLSVNILTEKKKFDGHSITVAEVVGGDSTGIVTLIVRNGKPQAFNVSRAVRCSEGRYNNYYHEFVGKDLGFSSQARC